MRARYYAMGIPAWRDMGPGNGIREGQIEIHGSMVKSESAADLHRVAVREHKRRAKAKEATQ
jgi:hypothetical protein